MLKPNDYQLLFQIETNYLIADMFAQHYKKLECLLILKNGLWKSFIPHRVVEKTHEDGLEIYSNAGKFNIFKSEFNNFINSSGKELQEILSKQLTSESIERFLNVISEIWKYYSKTEFFYSDKAANKLIESNNDQLAKNLKELEQIKNNGRIYMNSLIFTENNYLDKLLSLISQKTGTSNESLKWYKIKEIAQSINGHKIEGEEISRRQKFFAIMGDGSKLEYVNAEEISEEFDAFFVFDGKKELRGTIANKGIVRGKVKVFPQNYYSNFSILSKLFEEMNQGDILVAETTSPELMPACAKAAAIVTNQGGLLSHAAIISREMNIPCIIGIGNATEILKDGDMVEVDADRGVVKIIK